jgi:peroxiredoxin
MEQVVDLQRDERFQSLGVEVLSLSPDQLVLWKNEVQNLDITTPVLSDEGNQVAKEYGVMRWAVGAEPGHTFVLVDEQGRIRWLRDYGAPENGGLMYVEPKDIHRIISPFISGAGPRG